ncbi:beta-galactosidase BglB [Phytohalomonas tamaricis]|uniref:beta-galactosidase BglB n=1 Tax=Phytohalomonas tamaricis TaxID=2081032 RepID=UPI000D0BC325|nr:glycoside hydrolase family 88 protein [Phytohalomonas tamaricis]
MNIYPVKHSPLLRQEERLLPRPEMVSLIKKVIENLVSINDESGEFLLYLDDGRTIDTKGWAGWEWTHGIGLYGIYRYYEQTGDEHACTIIDNWFAARFADRPATKNVNTVCPFLTLAYRYEEDRRREWLPYLERWSDWVMYEMPRTDRGGLQHVVYNDENHQELWDDTLMMSVLPLAKMGCLLNKPEFVEEAKYQFLVHIQYLMDRSTGAWYHGWTFDGHHNFAGARWARGNSWITVAIPELLELLDLPEQDGFRRFLVQTLTSQIEMIASTQADSGLWHTLLDDETSYLESSATAGFAYGILKATRLRYIDDRYRSIAEKAIAGVVNNINESGELENVSFGTAMGETLDYYKQIPLTSMPYGQAMAILCLSEYLRSYL